MPAHSCRSPTHIALAAIQLNSNEHLLRFVASYLGYGPKHCTPGLEHPLPKNIRRSNAMASATSKGICGICQGIIDTIHEVRWHTYLVHHQSRKSLERSARNHCGICTELLQYLCSGNHGQAPNAWDALFPIKCESDTSSASWQSSFELTLTSDGLRSFELRFVLEVIKAPECESIFSTTTHNSGLIYIKATILNMHPQSGQPLPRVGG